MATTQSNTRHAAGTKENNQVHRRGRLPHAALLIDNADDHAHSFLPFIDSHFIIP